MRNRFKTFPFIKQAGFMECGTTCLAMIFKYYGYYDIRSFLSEKAEVNTEGIDLLTISELAEGFGFESDGYQLNYENLQNVELPCIAHYDGNHFVVVYKITKEKVWIADPAVSKYELSKKDFEAKWNGIVLILKPTPEVFKHNELTELVEATRKKGGNVFSRFYLPTFLSSRKFLTQIILGTLFLQLLGLALPFFTQTIIDQALVNENVKLLYAILIGMVLVFVSQVVITYARNILLVQLKVTFEHAFFSKFFEHFLSLQQSYFDKHKREDFINRFQENLKIRNVFNPAILEAVIDFIFVITYLIVLFFYNTQLGAISTIFVAVYILFIILFSPRLKNLGDRIFVENGKTMGQFLDTLLGMQSVRLLGIEKIRFWKWKNQYTKALNNVVNIEKEFIVLSTVLKSVFLSSQVVIYWLGAYLTFKNELTIGQYIAFITVFAIIINALSKVSNLWFLFTELSVTFDKLNDLLIQKPVDTSFENKVALKGPFTIHFKDVHFKYRSKEEKFILENINLEIKEGDFVGIVGRNGSGKTTLVKLLSKLYENYEGKISINETEIRNILPGQLRKKMAVIPQEVFLFDGTIKENILYGNPQATDEEVVMAAKMADIHDFIKDQYLGYNLKIGENGANLSGGQKLKIAFARLFVSNPEIIILDEASSALDVETEKKIMNNVRLRFKGKTIISIAHRLHTIKDASQIILLDKGKVAGVGTHAHLMNDSGLYKIFFETYVNF